jgi:hypothetical protein
VIGPSTQRKDGSTVFVTTATFSALIGQHPVAVSKLARSSAKFRPAIKSQSHGKSDRWSLSQALAVVVAKELSKKGTSEASYAQLGDDLWSETDESIDTLLRGGQTWLLVVNDSATPRLWTEAVAKNPLGIDLGQFATLGMRASAFHVQPLWDKLLAKAQRLESQTFDLEGVAWCQS